MSVVSEIQTSEWRLVHWVNTAKRTRLRILSFAGDPNLIVVLAFVVVGLILSLLFPLSPEMAMELAPML
jgi:hypothetical protein